MNWSEDADQNMFDEPVTAAKKSPVQAGYGLLPRLTSARTPIHMGCYRQLRPINVSNLPIAPTMRSCKIAWQRNKNHGHYLLVDCHRCSHRPYNRHLPDIVLGIAMAEHWRPIFANRLMISFSQKISQLVGTPPIQAAISPAITAKPPALANLCK